MNWDDVRFFLVLARRRTQAAAARELRVAQPTVGRRIEALERRLGARLFVKRSDGFVLSSAGAEVLANAERMEQDALAVERRVYGRDQGLQGTVRVTASEWLVTNVLSGLLAPCLAEHPQLSVELVAESRHVNLARREADLALRPRRFDHDAVVQRATGKLAFALYASREYLSQYGRPAHGEGRGHRIIAMSEETGDVAREWLQSILPGASVAARTNGRDPMLALATAGVGLACLARIAGDRAPGLRRIVMPSEPTPTLWLGMHREARSAERVRVVAAHLTRGIHALTSELNPPGRRMHPPRSS